MKHVVASFMLVVFILGLALLLSQPHDLEDMTGRAASSVYIGDFRNSSCSFEVYEGWNLISIHCDGQNMSMGSVFSSIEESIVSIHNYDRAASQDKWKAYKPDLPSWVVQDLKRVSVYKGYWLLVDDNGVVEYNGSLKYPRITTLLVGWNLIGYPTNQTRLVNYTFADVLYGLTSVHLYNASDGNDPWKVYSTEWNGTLNDLTYMYPNFGYWVKMNQSGTWTVEET